MDEGLFSREEITKQVIKWLKDLGEDGRMDVFDKIARHFCMYCGRDDPDCQCMNDE